MINRRRVEISSLARTHSNYMSDSALTFGFSRVDVRSNLDWLGYPAAGTVFRSIGGDQRALRNL
jgi:hypothetical protein